MDGKQGDLNGDEDVGLINVYYLLALVFVSNTHSCEIRIRNV